MKCKVGDVVTAQVQGRVSHIENTIDSHVQIHTLGWGPRWFSREEIISVEPRPIAVGDRVQRKDYPDSGEVMAIKDDQLAVWVDGSWFVIWGINEVERVDD